MRVLLIGLSTPGKHGKGTHGKQKKGVKIPLPGVHNTVSTALDFRAFAPYRVFIYVWSEYAKEKKWANLKKDHNTVSAKPVFMRIRREI